ncbi:leucine-rich repeat domain-containing protein, partial [Bacteroides hominis]
QDIGDWHDKNVTGSMIVQGKMLREIRLGHKTAGIVISISSLTLSNCVSLQKLVLSRISTLAGTLNLTACSHLKEVYIDGTSITQLRLPAGGGLELVEFNALSRYLVLKNYPLMKNSGVLIDECAAVITDFFISDCPLMQPIKLLTQIMDAQQGQGAGHSLKRVRAVGFDETYNTSDMLDKLAALADGSYVGLDSEGVAGEDEYPVLDGTLNVYANAYEDSIQALRGTFKRLELNVIGKYFIRFTDKIVAQRVFELWDVNGDGGLTRDEADLITSIPRYFLSGDKNENYKNITSLVGFESLSNCTEIGYGAFENTNLETAVFPPNLKQIYQRAFTGTKIRKANLPDSCTFLSSGGGSDYMPFYNCSELEEFTMKDFIIPPERHYTINKGFSDCPKLKKFRCNSFEYGYDSIATTFALLSFSNCVSLEECDFGELKGYVNSMSYGMFENTPIAASCVPVNIIKSASQSYNNCTKLRVVVFEGNLDVLGLRMFFGCNSVTVIFKSMTPPTTLEYGGLSNVVAIYVPDTAVSDYKSSVISGYASIIFPLSEYNGYMPTKLYEI